MRAPALPISTSQRTETPFLSCRKKPTRRWAGRKAQDRRGSLAILLVNGPLLDPAWEQPVLDALRPRLMTEDALALAAFRFHLQRLEERVAAQVSALQAAYLFELRRPRFIEGTIGGARPDRAAGNAPVLYTNPLSVTSQEHQRRITLVYVTYANRTLDLLAWLPGADSRAVLSTPWPSSTSSSTTIKDLPPHKSSATKQRASPERGQPPRRRRPPLPDAGRQPRRPRCRLCRRQPRGHDGRRRSPASPPRKPWISSARPAAPAASNPCLPMTSTSWKKLPTIRNFRPI